MLVLKRLLWITLLLASTAISADFEAGQRAYEKGDYLAALREWAPLAGQGNPAAQTSLGLMYYKGHGLPQNSMTAAAWFSAAAEQGYERAQYFLGLFYYDGEGVAKNYGEAIKWFRKVVERDPTKEGAPVRARAESHLGRMYFHGDGVPQDYQSALHWFRLAAEKGDADAEYYLGRMYFHGTGLPQDYQQAARWYRPAAERGQRWAVSDLGMMYANGFGVPQDYLEAVKWFRLAAENGVSLAQLNLGKLYVRGNGVPQDYVLGHMWTNLAAANGEDGAGEFLNLLARVMTPAQITEAQRLAREWRPKSGTASEKPPDLRQTPYRKEAAVPTVVPTAAAACRDLEPLWAEGRELKRVSCAGVTVAIDANPHGGPLPFSYGVVMRNDSNDTIEIDWQHWKLMWADKRGPTWVSPAIDPVRVEARWRVDRSLKRTTLGPGGVLFGWVYFQRPKTQTCEVFAEIPKLPQIRFSVSAVPR